MLIQPLRNMLLVRLKESKTQSGGIVLIRDDRLARPATVEAIGPEVLDLKVGDVVVVNVVAGTAVGDTLLLSESAVLGTL